MMQYSDLINSSSPYPFAEIDKKVSELKAKGVKVIDFGVGDPTSPTPDFVIDAMHKAAIRHKSTGYPSYIGSRDYRFACARYMKNNFGVDLNPDTEISSSIGSKESVFNFPLGFINPGDVVICPSPGYPPYRVGTKFAGGEVYNVPLLENNNFLIDFESIPSDVVKKAKIIWINYPNSPTGVLASDEWMMSLIKWAKENNIIIAADEGCYIDIYFDKKPRSILEFAKEGVITFYSMSKRNNMTGYRVGFVAGDSKIIDGFKKVKTNIDSGTPSFIQDAAIIAMDDMNHVAQMREEYRQKRDILISAFDKIGLERTKSESTFYVWQKAPDGMSDIDFAQKFVDLGIVATPGSFISSTCQDGINPGYGYLRFALVPTIEDVKFASEQILKMKF
jgi:LL-diaminopimelate aminotransferase